MKSSPLSSRKQKLSPEASMAKAARDLAMAKTPYRRAAKADYDHKSGTFKSVKANRGNDGKGTKKEGKSNYKI